MLAWDAESGEPLTPIVVWQDKRSQEVLDRLADREDEVTAAQRPAVRPLLLGRQARLAAGARRGGRAARATPGTLRMGTVDSFLCDRLGAGFATDPSTGSRTQLQRSTRPASTRRCCEIFGVPPEVLPEIRDTAGELGDPPPPELAGRAAALRPGASTSRRRWPAPAASCRAASRRPTAPASSSSPTSASEVPQPARRPAADGRLAHRRPRPSTRSTAASSPPGRCSSGSAASSGLAADPAGARRARPRAPRTPAGARVLPGAGGHRRAVVAPERARGARRALRRHDRRAHVARAALEGSPGGSPTSSPRSASRVDVDACASTAGSPTSR